MPKEWTNVVNCTLFNKILCFFSFSFLFGCEKFLVWLVKLVWNFDSSIKISSFLCKKKYRLLWGRKDVEFKVCNSMYDQKNKASSRSITSASLCFYIHAIMPLDTKDLQ